MIEFDYKSPKWKRLRQKALRRDQYQCQECRRYGRLTPATEVHHIAHVDTAPELAWDLDNLRSLCHACHNKMHPEKGKKGLSRRYKGNPYGEFQP